jgi:hypothetical protein
MDKVILILDGISTGKNIFINTIKANGYWTWNINCYNVPGMCAHKLGYKGERNADYYEFVNIVKDLADKYFDFERSYTFDMINKFMDNDKAKVLIFHNINSDLVYEVKEKYSNTFSLLIVDNDEIDESYEKTLNYTKGNYTDQILSVMQSLTKSFSKSNEEI